MTVRYLSRTILVFILILAGGIGVSAQRKVPTAEQILDITGSQGTEFWIAIPPNETNPYPVDQLEVYVASAFDTELEVFDASGSKTYKRQIKSYDIRTLSDLKGETNWTWEVRNSEQVEKKGVRLRSKMPISVYVINSKRFTSDGYMAIPVNGWGRDYIATSYYDMKEFKNWAGGFLVVARENGTVIDVTLRGTGELDGKTAGGRSLNIPPYQVTLDEGDVYMVKGDALTRGIFDLTGSRVTADKPIGFFSFHERTTMPNLLQNGNGRNHLVEMTPPVTAWGKKYVSIELQRENNNGVGKGDVFRVIAKDPNTRWSLKYYDKVTKKLVGQGGGFLGKAGEFADITQSGAPTTITWGYSVWTADKPIFVMQYSCSSSWDGDPILDPFMFNITPEEQFITSTIFQFPTAGKFGKHRLNLIVKTDTSSPDYINNLKSLEIDGVPVWNHPKAASPTLLFTKMFNGLHWTTIDFGVEAKAHRIKSNGKVSFGGYIYGYGEFDAYGWPAAAGFKPTTSVDTMPPLIKADSLCGDYTFETTELRNIPDPPLPVPIDTDQVETGIAQIDTVPGFNSYNYELKLVTSDLLPKDPSYKKFKYEWNVIDKSKDAYCVYFVQDWAGNTTFDTCFYFADKLTFTPNPLNFGKIRVGTTKTLDLTITNNSDGVVILRDSRIKLGTYYTVTAGALPPVMTIQSKASHTISITYDGRRETNDVTKDFDLDTIRILTACGEFNHPITGVAAVPRITVEDFDAGTVSLDQQSCKIGGLKITNPGSDTLVISAITGWAGTNFTLSTPSTPPLPISIPPKASVYLKDVCYKSSTITVDDINVTLNSNGLGPDSISNWKGNTQSPGPIIRGYDWLERRVGTLHQALGSVSNTGNQVLTLRDVTFTDGTKYYPAGRVEANYVFKIVGLFKNGAPVTTIDLSNGESVDVMVMFRPDGEAAFSADIIPVWVGTVDPRSAKLKGIGIIPKIATAPVTLNCAETPEGTETQRQITITNAGTMPLTVKGVVLRAPVPAGYAIVTTPPLPFTVLPTGGTQNVTVAYTRPIGTLGATTATVEFVHDATPGTGQDSSTLVAVPPHAEVITVASCSEPDFSVADIDYGRRLANCEAPILRFPITNVSGSLKPLEVRAIVESGPDANAFEILRILDAAGNPTTLPLTLSAGQAFQVEVQFTPTEPNAAPWANRTYNAQYDVTGYGQGNTAPLKTLTANVTGIGYVVPVTFNLVNDIPAGGTKEPGAIVSFTIDGQSADWTDGDVKSFIADVTFVTDNLEYTPGSTVIGSALTGGWTVGDPVITQLNPTQSQMRFTGTGGTRINGNGQILSFKATLLLADQFSSKQDLTLTLARPCLVPSATGDSTAIFNCALTRRVVSIGNTKPTLAGVSPNPVSSGSAHVEFSVGITSVTTLDLVNAQGVVVKTFVNNRLQDGHYEMTFSTQGLTAGVYFLRMNTAAYSSSQQVVIIE
ncbi:MAG: choice-of-anchor D domain-containing protein [Candidatus Kapabacteria bacterium]|nr:choice-of-anchor D domain-containing protein [Candidatus Kapabacteria bacterium]